MKYILLTLLLPFLSVAQGIDFLQVNSLQEARAAAIKQNKLLFMEIYAPDCHICNSFKGVFTQAAVGALYNKNFVNYQLDIRNPANEMALKQAGIILNATPTFVFFEPKSMKIVQARIFGEKDNTVTMVNGIGSKAANPAEQASQFPKRLAAGEKNPGMLINYAQFARITGDTLANIKAMNAYIALLKPAQYSSQSTFNLMQVALMSHDNRLFDYFIRNLNYYNSIFDPSVVRMVYENIFQITLTSSCAVQLGEAGMMKLKSQMAKTEIDRSSIVRRTWMVESDILFKQRKATQAMKVIDELINSMPGALGPKENQFLCDYVKGKTKDASALKKAKSYWCLYGTK
ncbi:thioredoxin family protein [Aquirufa sp. A-Brett2-W8]